MKDEDDLRRLLNATGFAFQLAIEESIRKTHTEHGWEVAAREHPWVHEATGTSGHIDIVLEKNAGRLVLECKRTSDARWLFLIPKAEDRDSVRFRSLWCHIPEEGDSLLGWGEFRVLPANAESQFCNVRGSGEGKITLLERLASELARSVEGLASEEGQIARQGTFFPHIYIPVIVTNAELVVATVDPSAIPLGSGKLDDATFRRVPSLRFRKALDGGPLARPRRIGTVRESNREYQRSVMIVAAEALVQFLSDVDLKKINEWESWPWEPLLRRQGR